MADMLSLDYSLPNLALLSVVVTAGFVGFDFLTGSAQSLWCGGKPFWYSYVPHKAKPLADDKLIWKDHLFVFINRSITTPLYLVALVRYLGATKSVEWSYWPNILAVAQVLAIFGIYDAIYVPFHGTLHQRWIYPYIHKHHHHQVSPFRGAFDGVNTHPFEYAFGIYLHLWSLRILEMMLRQLGTSIPSLGPLHVHGTAVVVFLVASSLMAGLNHSRFGVRIPFVFDIRDHDVHHRVPYANYGQFVMWWDRLYGSYKPYVE